MLSIILPDGKVIDGLESWIEREESPLEWHMLLTYWFRGDATVVLVYS